MSPVNAGVRALIILSTTSLGTAAIAQTDEPSRVDIPWTLAVGDSVALEFTRSREQSGPDVRREDVTIRNLVSFAVTERNDQGFVLAWRTSWDELTQTLALAQLPDEIGWLEDLGEILSAHELLIQADDLGAPIGLLNVDETAALFEGLLDRTLGSFDLDEEESSAAESILGKMLAPEVIVSRVLQDANLYLMFAGGQFELEQEYRVETEIANPLGGPPFPAVIRFTVRSVDPETGVAHIDYSQTTEARAVRAFMEEMFSHVPDGAEVLKEMEGQELGIFASAAYDIDLASGLPNHVLFERTVRVGPGARIDRIAVESIFRPSPE